MEISFPQAFLEQTDIQGKTIAGPIPTIVGLIKRYGAALYQVYQSGGEQAVGEAEQSYSQIQDKLLNLVEIADDLKQVAETAKATEVALRTFSACCATTVAELPEIEAAAQAGAEQEVAVTILELLEDIPESQRERMRPLLDKHARVLESYERWNASAALLEDLDELVDSFGHVAAVEEIPTEIDRPVVLRRMAKGLARPAKEVLNIVRRALVTGRTEHEFKAFGRERAKLDRSRGKRRNRNERRRPHATWAADGELSAKLNELR